jgi:hypothetical protein
MTAMLGARDLKLSGLIFAALGLPVLLALGSAEVLIGLYSETDEGGGVRSREKRLLTPYLAMEA